MVGVSSWCFRTLMRFDFVLLCIVARAGSVVCLSLLSLVVLILSSVGFLCVDSVAVSVLLRCGSV